MDNKDYSREELIEKITSKKEFSQLPEKDVEIAYDLFDKPNKTSYQKLKCVRNFLRKIYTSFTSRKILTGNYRNRDWVLSKHKSTKERFECYEEIYSRLLEEMNKKLNVIDLGCGVNGFSYDFFKQAGYNVNYVGVEAVGQLVYLMNKYFRDEKIKNARAVHESLFELEKIKRLVKEINGEKVIFLFKVIDSLEDLKRNYSKEFVSELVPFVDRFVISFATKSLGKRSSFGAKRTWLKRFLKENFKILDEFEINGENYIIFKK